MAKNDDVTRSKVEIKGDEPVILYQSDREVPMDEIKEHCEVNDIEVPEEDDSRYWDLVGDFHTWDYEDFESNLKASKKLPGLIVITGELGLWDGTHTIIPVMMDMAADPMKVIQKFALSSDFEMTIGYDKEGLFVTVHHHDGTNRYLFRVFKEGTTEEQRYNLEEKLFLEKATRADITRITRRLGDEIGKVYGWSFPQHGRNTREEAR